MMSLPVAPWVSWLDGSNHLPQMVHRTADGLEELLKWMESEPYLKATRTGQELWLLAYALIYRDMMKSTEIEPDQAPPPNVAACIVDSQLDFVSIMQRLEDARMMFYLWIHWARDHHDEARHGGKPPPDYELHRPPTGEVDAPGKERVNIISESDLDPHGKAIILPHSEPVRNAVAEAKAFMARYADKLLLMPRTPSPEAGPSKAGALKPPIPAPNFHDLSPVIPSMPEDHGVCSEEGPLRPTEATPVQSTSSKPRTADGAGTATRPTINEPPSQERRADGVQTDKGLGRSHGHGSQPKAKGVIYMPQPSALDDHGRGEKTLGKGVINMPQPTNPVAQDKGKNVQRKAMINIPKRSIPPMQREGGDAHGAMGLSINPETLPTDKVPEQAPVAAQCETNQSKHKINVPNAPDPRAQSKRKRTDDEEGATSSHKNMKAAADSGSDVDHGRAPSMTGSMADGHPIKVGPPQRPKPRKVSPAKRKAVEEPYTPNKRLRFSNQSSAIPPGVMVAKSPDRPVAQEDGWHNQPPFPKATRRRVKQQEAINESRERERDVLAGSSITHVLQAAQPAHNTRAAQAKWAAAVADSTPAKGTRNAKKMVHPAPQSPSAGRSPRTPAPRKKAGRGNGR